MSSMENTLKKRLPAFVGGQLHISNEREGYHYCGQIKTTGITKDCSILIIHTTFVWLVKQENHQWVQCSLMTHDMGIGHNITEVAIKDDKIILNCHKVGEVATFILPGDKDTILCP